MILKLCNPGGADMYVAADTIIRDPLADSELVSVSASFNGAEVGRWRVGDLAISDYCRAYVLENGKTVDRIRAYARPEH